MVRTAYATTLEVYQYLRWNKRVPGFSSGVTPKLEVVDSSGTLGSASIVFLDHNRIIDNTLDLSYGISSAFGVNTSLTVDTDYTIDLDNAKITLNGVGAGKVGSSNLYAEYQYNDFIEDSVLSDMIDRAVSYLDNETHQYFGSSNVVEREEQSGRGRYDRIYRPLNLPVNFTQTQINTASIATADTVLHVDSTVGFIPNDILSVNKETMRVSSVDSSTQMTVSRGYLNTANIASHSENDDVVNFVLEISETYKGNTPVYKALTFKKDYDLDSNTGAVQLLHTNAEDKDDLVQDTFPLFKTFDRVKLSYRYGKNDFNEDLRKLTILIIARDNMTSTLAKTIPEGIDGFNPQVMDNIDKEIEKLLRKYRLLLSRGF